MVGGEVGEIFEPEIAGAGEFRMEFPFQAADLIDGVVDETDHVELVEGEGGVGQMIANAFDESLGHVGADLGNRLWISLMGAEVLSEGGDGGGIFAGSDEQDFALLEIDEQGNVVLAAAGSGLIDADLSDGGMVGLAAGRIHVMVEDAPNQGVVFTDQARGGQDRHGLDESEDEGFKQQGEAAVRPSPGYVDTVYAAPRTLDAGGAGVEKGLVLEEVQVAPSEGFGIVGFAGSGAEGTSKGSAARKVEVEIEASGFDGETAMVNQPGWQQPQRRLEQFVFVHVVEGSVRIAGCRQGAKAAAGRQMDEQTGGELWE